MRKPKKLTALLLALTLLFACAACGSGNNTTDSGKTISGTLPEIIDRLYDTVDVDDEQRDFLKNSVGTVEIPKDQSAYYFGVENLDFEEAVARTPPSGSAWMSTRTTCAWKASVTLSCSSWRTIPKNTAKHSTPSPSKKQNLTKTPKIAMMNINAA